MPSNLRCSTRNHNILVKTPVMSQLALNYPLEYNITMRCANYCFDTTSTFTVLRGVKWLPGNFWLNLKISESLVMCRIFLCFFLFSSLNHLGLILKFSNKVTCIEALQATDFTIHYPSIIKTFQSQVQNINSFFWQSCTVSSFNISSENWVVNQRVELSWGFSKFLDSF